MLTDVVLIQTPSQNQVLPRGIDLKQQHFRLLLRGVLIALTFLLE